jgi:hypothetical protein
MPRKIGGISRALATALLLVPLVCAQQPPSSQPPGNEEPLTIHLQADAGTPLRAYLTEHVWYRQNEPVKAKLIEPVWSFDRQIVPAGAILQGHITELVPVPKMMRAKAILGGDFTPLKRARITFTSVVLADGHAVEIQALPSLGLGTYYVPPRPKKVTANTQTPKSSNSLVETAKQQVQAELQTQSRGLYELVRTPNKREWLEDWLLTKLPYHRQWYRSGMRIDSILAQAADFGAAQVPAADLKEMGTAPPPDSIAQMRLSATATSAEAKVGDPLRGVLAQPLFNSKNQLVLPQGTQLMGKITLARPARMFHRGGKLRFAIEDFQLPAEAAERAALPAEPTPTRAQLALMETAPTAAMKVDEEGTATATESKTRLIRPVIAALVAAKSLDNDAGRQTSASGTGNAPARGLAGFSGFGLLGWAASKGPHPVSAALGFYGLGWSIYTNVISRGIDVTLEKDTEAAIRFGSPARAK